MKLNNSTIILSVKLINSDDGTESTLTERPGIPRMHFRERFPSQGYLIQQRLDWDDITDENGNPMLDADIWKEINGKKEMLPKRHPSHHTEKKFDEKTGKKLYPFKFGNLTQHLTTKMTIAKPFSGNATLMRTPPEAE